MKEKVQEYTQDVVYCLKLSLKILVIPVVMGIVYGIGYLLINDQPLELVRICIEIRNVGIMFSCFGLFISALGFLRPGVMLRPLSYEKSWRKYLKKFGLVGTIFCTCGFLISYFLVFDLVVYKVFL
ncbi:MAG: hypothetical protein RR891_03150 [Clostridium sp.]|uniref:hypothetical protein n=1 Tax=Clostridium sp. TaxID=1506 RepID=UPI00305494A6